MGLWFVFLAFFSQAPSADHDYARPTVHVSELRLSGAVDQRMYEQVRDFDGSVITIDSTGGNILWGTRIAEILATSNVELRVERNCISACFTYFFLPAAKRILGSRAVLGLHVGPVVLAHVAEREGATLPAREQKLASLTREVLAARGLSESVFVEAARRLGVRLINRPLLCRHSERIGDLEELVPCQWYEAKVRTWYIDTKQLREHGIEFEGYEIVYRSPQDVPVSVLLFHGNEDAFFGDCLYSLRAEEVWRCGAR